MLNITELFKILIFKIFKFDNNKIINNNNSRLNEKLTKFKKYLALKYALIFLKLAFTDIKIKIEAINFFKKLIF